MKNLSVTSEDIDPGLVMHLLNLQPGINSHIDIYVKECLFLGSCVSIIGNIRSTEIDYTYTYVNIIGMTMHGSRCPVALTVNASVPMSFKDTTVSHSHHEAVHIISKHSCV